MFTIPFDFVSAVERQFRLASAVRLATISGPWPLEVNRFT
jgi:hypothetical protein